ncbi:MULTISPECIES: hypothetical protein [unclassified Caballeronia]|uniref:hypothetical protein n=1 Tax=unclassified Caballeronia TaxID=2646786 RepID=UPI00285BCA73|nr:MULTISPECIES: hypothetical protein [unclassified Caballeronia]MDR5740676.1 hypothetical protein [Caballeronia sp. LZ016]MDR5808800.1 hypothetical protein [Caballeronia sp. LZ019]
MSTHAGRSQEDRISAREGEKLPSQEQAGGDMAVEGTEAGKNASSGALSEAGKDVWRQGSTIDQEGPLPPDSKEEK